MIGLSGFKSGDFVFINIASPFRLRGNDACIAVEAPPLASERVACIIRHRTREFRLIAVFKADSDIIYLNQINYRRVVRLGRYNRFNIGKTQVSICGGNRCHCVPVHRSGDFSAEVIFPFRHQQNGIYIFFFAFKRSNGRQGAVCPVVGMPYSHGHIVFI